MSRGIQMVLVNVSPQDFGTRFSKGNLPVLSSLPEKMNHCRCVYSDITHLQIAKFLHSGCRIIEQEKHGKIPATFGSGNIRLFHQYIGLAITQILDYRFFRTLAVNGKNTLAQCHFIWPFDLNVLCKGFQCSKTLVSGGSAVSTFRFQMRQKFENEIARKVADACFFQLKPSLPFEVIIEEDKSISVGMNRVNTHVFGASKVLFEIAGHHIRIIKPFLHCLVPP